MMGTKENQNQDLFPEDWMTGVEDSVTHRLDETTWTGNSPALKDMESQTVASIAAVENACLAIEEWAANCDSVDELQDASSRLAAIAEYLNRTSTEGRARVAAAMRRLETRIGALLEPVENHGPATPHRDDRFHPQQIADFRQMAAHPDIVERVITESNDEAPASRRKVSKEIRHALEEARPDAKVGVDRDQLSPALSAVQDMQRATRGINPRAAGAAVRGDDSCVADYLKACRRVQRWLVDLISGMENVDATRR